MLVNDSKGMPPAKAPTLRDVKCKFVFFFFFFALLKIKMNKEYDQKGMSSSPRISPDEETPALHFHLGHPFPVSVDEESDFFDWGTSKFEDLNSVSEDIKA